MFNEYIIWWFRGLTLSETVNRYALAAFTTSEQTEEIQRGKTVVGLPGTFSRERQEIVDISTTFSLTLTSSQAYHMAQSFSMHTRTYLQWKHQVCCSVAGTLSDSFWAVSHHTKLGQTKSTSLLSCSLSLNYCSVYLCFCLSVYLSVSLCVWVSECVWVRACVHLSVGLCFCL